MNRLPTLILVLGLASGCQSCLLSKGTPTDYNNITEPPTHRPEPGTTKVVHTPPASSDTLRADGETDAEPVQAEVLCHYEELKVEVGPKVLKAVPIPVYITKRGTYTLNVYEQAAEEADLDNVDEFEYVYAKRIQLGTVAGDRLGSLMSAAVIKMDDGTKVMWSPDEWDSDQDWIEFKYNGQINLMEYISPAGVTEFRYEIRARPPYTATYMKAKFTFDVYTDCEVKL